MKNKQDDYDEAIEYLTEHPDEIENAWTGFDDHEAGCLFAVVTPSGKYGNNPASQYCGCLTQIRRFGVQGPSRCISFVAWSDQLTKDIVADKRIPLSITGVTVADLPVFAEWQRRLDKEIRQPVAEPQP